MLHQDQWWNAAVNSVVTKWIQRLLFGLDTKTTPSTFLELKKLQIGQN